MNNKPLVSVIIPTYNRKNTIKYCIDSVLNQTYQNFEIIVVDDCSIDNTVEIVKNIKDERIRCFVLDKNSGAQTARNEGIKNAKYDWIAFQDSDDEWLPNKLELQIKELEKINFDKKYVIHGNCNVFNHEKNETTYWSLPLTEKECYQKLLTNPTPLFPAILTSKEILQKIDFLDENVPSYQEWDTSIRLSKYCKFIHIQEPLFIYHQHKGETISKNLIRDILGYQYIINKHKNEIIEKCGYEIWKQHITIQVQKCINWKILKNVFYYQDSKFPEIFSELVDFLIMNVYTNFGYKEKYENIKKSKSFKLGNMLLKPFIKLKHAQKNNT